MKEIKKISELKAFVEEIPINNEICLKDYPEEIYIHRYGIDDYSIAFKNGDWSSRGNKDDIIKEYEEWKIQNENFCF